MGCFVGVGDACIFWACVRFSCCKMLQSRAHFYICLSLSLRAHGLFFFRKKPDLMKPFGGLHVLLLKSCQIGDGEASASRIAGVLGINNVQAQLSPEKKLEMIEQVRAKKLEQSLPSGVIMARPSSLLAWWQGFCLFPQFQMSFCLL